MNETTLLIAFIAVTAVAVVLQMLILAGMYSTTRKASRRIDALSIRVNEQVLPLVEKVRAIVDTSAPQIQTVIANLTETSTLVRQQAGQIDEAITEIVGIARTQAGNAGELAARTMRRVDRTAETLQHTVATPMRQFSALLEGVAAGFGELTAGRKSRRSKAEPTDEMFI
jgi:outer membrane murein-binding lipoprotein Lpp